LEGHAARRTGSDEDSFSGPELPSGGRLSTRSHMGSSNQLHRRYSMTYVTSPILPQKRLRQETCRYIHPYAVLMGDPAGLLIYDADCGFCSRVASWLVRHWDSSESTLVGSQQLSDVDLAALGLDRRQVLEALWWHDGEGLRRGHHAVAAGLQRAGPLLSACGRLLQKPIFNWLGARCYSFVAAHRHQLPGSGPACRVDNSN